MSVETQQENTYFAIGAIIILAILRFVYVHITFVDLAPDEAQYWLWSQYLDWSYYSKGPLVAWLIGLSSAIFGDTVLGVKFFAIVGTSLISWLSFTLVRDWRGDKAGFYALALLNATPLLGVGGLLMVPDVPVTLLWLLALWLLTKQEVLFNAWKRFIGIGVAIGIAGLAKYTAGLFYPLVGLYLIVNKKRQLWLKKPHIYISGIISLVCLAPIFYWNLTHDFVGFKHVLGQVGGEGDTNWLDTFGNFIGGQAAMSGGFVFFFLLAYWVTFLWQETEEKGKIFWWFSAPLFVFFCLKAFGAKVQPNWPVLSIVVGFIGLSGWIVVQRAWVQKAFVVALCISALVTVIGHDTHMIRYLGVNLTAKKDPLKPALGWHGLGEQISEKIQEMPTDTVILTTRYQTASEFAFYVKNKNGERPEVLYVNPGYRRQNQFDYWPWPALHNRSVIYINEAKTLEPKVAEAFRKCHYIDKLASTRANPNGEPLILKTAHMYLCEGYRGMVRTLADKF